MFEYVCIHIYIYVCTYKPRTPTSSLATCAALLASRVPASWSNLAFDSVLPLHLWLQDLGQRYTLTSAPESTEEEGCVPW